MMDSSGQTGNRFLRHYALAGLVIAAWFLLYQDALLSAARIWYISEIFTHGFFILPGALYLIWRERESLQHLTPNPNYWVLTLLLPFLFLGLFGVVGGIQVFSHISAFAVLPLIVWLCFGNAIAKAIWFPLCFVLFSIPAGEELVPLLQKITADMAITILKWTSVPVYTSGLYIEIPQGRFVVAEACSGIRFFIGSLVFGAIYSHITYASFKRKVAFMVLATVVPVVANALRVFGIVMIGYFSDMKYATGADHLVYGWVFFGIVLLMLVMIGELFKEKVAVSSNTEKQTLSMVLSELKNLLGAMSELKVPLVLVLFMLALTGFWQSQVALDEHRSESRIDRDVLSKFTGEQPLSSDWRPVLSGEQDFFHGKIDGGDLVIAWFAENRSGSELISSANRLYDIEAWSEMGSEKIIVNTDEENWSARLLRITSSIGRQHMLLYWYQLSDKGLVSRVKTKLWQTADVLMGGKGAGALIVFAAPYSDGSYDVVLEQLVLSAERHGSRVVDAIPY